MEVSELAKKENKVVEPEEKKEQIPETQEMMEVDEDTRVGVYWK